MFVKWSGPRRRGRQVRYLQLVHSYVADGQHRHRLIANLGELSQRQIAVLVKSFNRLLDHPFVLRAPRGRHAIRRRPRA